MSNNNTARERQWRAEEDARTLATYEEIISDPKRMKYASQTAKLQAEELSKRADTMKKVASKTVKKGGK